MNPWDDGSDPYSADLISAMSTLPLQQKALEAKQRRAQMLMGMAPAAAGATVGRTYVASSPLEHLASALMKARGLSTARDAEEAYAPMIQQAQQGAAEQFRLGRNDKNRAFRLQVAKEEREGKASEAKIAHDAGMLGVSQEDLTRKKAADAAIEADRAARLSLDTRKLDQPHWAFGQDASGGGFLFNQNANATPVPTPLAPLGVPGGPGSVTPKPKDLEEDVQKLGKDMEPLSKARSDINLLRSAADKGSVAGFGPVEGRMPNLVTGQEGVANRQAAGRLMAAIIQATSGQAASEKEVDRLLEANGMGRTATDEQFRQGIQKLDAQYQSLTREREAKYHPSVVDVYRKRGGYGSGQITAPDDLRKKYGL